MTKLETINAEDLQNRTYEPTPFLVDELIPEGLHILAGAPKIGKSWLALWLCLCVSQGQPLWNFAVTQGEVLYLSLEDSYRRIQSRLFDLTEDAADTALCNPGRHAQARIGATDRAVFDRASDHKACCDRYITACPQRRR